MWPFIKSKSNPAIIESEIVNTVKIRLNSDEIDAIERVIISRLTEDAPLNFQYNEMDRAIYLSYDKVHRESK